MILSDQNALFVRLWGSWKETKKSSSAVEMVLCCVSLCEYDPVAIDVALISLRKLWACHRSSK